MKQNDMFGMSLDERMVATKGRSTGFDYMRIALATFVIFMHSGGVSYGLGPPTEYFRKHPFPPFPIPVAQEYILPMFFALSGFLVAGSLYRTRTIGEFLGLRAIRILPALSVEVSLSALLIGPLLTVAPLSIYFSSPIFFSYFFNTIGYIHYQLPGLFLSNPWPNTVNSQLWTVPWELYCYLTLTALAVLRIVQRKLLFLGIVVLGTLAVLIIHVAETPGHIRVDPVVPGYALLMSFLSAVVIYTYKSSIPWSGWLAAACGAFVCIMFYIPGGDYLVGFPVAYMTIYLGLLNPVKIALLRGADYSYGLYLYGFVIQQAVAQMGTWTHHWYVNFLLSMITASAFAAFSWAFVERPALRLKRFFVSPGAETRPPTVETRLPSTGPIAHAVLALVSLALIVRSIFFVWKNYLIVLYWDQWALIDDFIHHEAATKSWTYLFKPHNEHVIATSKLLFALDWVLFHLTNLPLVISTMFLAVVVAWLVTTLVFWKMQRDRFFWTIWLILCASGFSLGQWENLLCGFQPQFNLVLIGTLASIIFALKVSEPQDTKDFVWLAALQFAMGFCVFSMGNGIAIPISVLFLLILFRVSLLKCLTTASFGVFYVATFSILTHGSGTPGGPISPKKLFDMVRFFFVVIGGAPFDADLNLAAILGIFVCVIFAALFVRYLALPWFKYYRADSGLAGLFALAIFLFATAAAAAWGRSFMGIVFAQTSRYATPMLVLWMMLFAVPIRLCLTSQIFLLNAQYRQDILWLSMIAALGTVAVSTLRHTDETDRMIAISRSVRQGAFFIASGVLNADDWKIVYWDRVYPDPNTMKSFIAFLREHQLNIFSPWMGLPKPSADEIQKLAFVKSMPVCTRGYIDDTTKIDSSSWKVRGWISDTRLQTPRWLLASDDKGQMLGYTEPLSSRPDVESAIGARHFRGFLLPFRVSDLAQRPYSVVAIFQGGEAACQLRLPAPLP
jgi:peptidoglycan/LPS O-acetylase OafA/YrhL